MKDAQVFCSDCDAYKRALDGCPEHDLPPLTDEEIEARCVYQLHGEEGYR